MTFDGYKAPSFLSVPGAKDVCIEMFSLSKMYQTCFYSPFPPMRYSAFSFFLFALVFSLQLALVASTAENEGHEYGRLLHGGAASSQEISMRINEIQKQNDEFDYFVLALSWSGTACRALPSPCSVPSYINNFTSLCLSIACLSHFFF
jgi:hypothetical protein